MKKGGREGDISGGGEESQREEEREQCRMAGEREKPARYGESCVEEG